MSKNKFSVHLEPGECCVVIPTDWARHVIASYRQMVIDADTKSDANAFQAFIESFQTWVEETAVEYYE